MSKDQSSPPKPGGIGAQTQIFGQSPFALPDARTASGKPAPTTEPPAPPVPKQDLGTTTFEPNPAFESVGQGFSAAPLPRGNVGVDLGRTTVDTPQAHGLPATGGRENLAATRVAVPTSPVQGYSAPPAGVPVAAIQFTP